MSVSTRSAHSLNVRIVPHCFRSNAAQQWIIWGSKRKFAAASTNVGNLCRFLGRRVAAFELRALFAGVREAPRHEIAGTVRGGFRQSYGELVPPGRASGTAERRKRTDMMLSRAGLDRGSLCGKRRIGRLRTGMVRQSCR